MNRPSSGRQPVLSLPSVVLALLGGLLLLALLLPLVNPGSWLGRAQPLVLGPADNPLATLSRHALLYKSDSRGLYLVVRSQWQLRGPLQTGDKVRVELLNDKGERVWPKAQDDASFVLVDASCSAEAVARISPRTATFHKGNLVWGAVS